MTSKALIVVPLLASVFLVGCQSAPPEESPSAQLASSEAVEGEEEEVTVICRKEYVMGSRVRREEVCRVVGESNDSAGDQMREIQNRGGNVGEPGGIAGN